MTDARKQRHGARMAGGDAPLAQRQQSMFGVIDIGSNSLRLVLYDRLQRAPKVLFNEKVMCGLGRGMAATGRLNPDGVTLAAENFERFVMLCRQLGVGRLDILATSAVRDAIDGPDFAAELERRCGVPITVVDGLREAQLAAFGIRFGIADAEGLAGDLGGGSAELAGIGPGLEDFTVSLPIGPVRLAQGAGDEARPRALVDQAIQGLSGLAAFRNKPFYAVGGTWRALARMHMEHTSYPLHVIQNYQLPRLEAETFFDFISRQSGRSMERIVGISRKRLEAVPLAAYVLFRLIRKVQPSAIVFSAFGLREGHLFELLPDAERAEDPLLAAAADMAEADPRFGVGGEELVGWTDPLFSDETPAQRRLRRAAALLSDLGWALHPDYRDEQIFTQCLRMPAPGLDHHGRVFLAMALHARYGGEEDAAVLAPVRGLIDDASFARARQVGLAFRLGYTLTGGAPRLIGNTALMLDPASVTLSVPEHTAIYTGEAVQRRLDALGRALGRRTSVRTEPPAPLGAARKRAARGG